VIGGSGPPEPPPLEKGQIMFAKWKPLVLAAAGIVTLLWLGPSNDSGETYSTSEVAINASAERGCVAQHGTRCNVDVRYAFPAAELFVLPEDVYF
jgi:hypothetical protein